jgi:hypothetical protein
LGCDSRCRALRCLARTGFEAAQEWRMLWRRVSIFSFSSKLFIWLLALISVTRKMETEFKE